MRLTRQALMLLSGGLSLAVFARPAWAQSDVPRVAYDNPIAGFGLTIPEDWEMATGVAGNTEIAIDAPTGAAVLFQPTLWFFYAPHSPEAQAHLLAQGLQAIGGGATPQVRATGKADEWEVTMTSDASRGPLVERWLCRSENGTSYVIGAMARPQVFTQFQDDIDTALSTCHLVGQPIIHFFREPTEDAYRLTLPHGWQWEGQIVRGENLPGAFTWKAQSADGLTGCFTSPPVGFDMTVDYMPAEMVAQGMVLTTLSQQVPGATVESVHPLPRASAYFAAVIKAAGPTMNPRVHRVRADYLGTVNGVRVRIRAYITTVMMDASPMFGGRGIWFFGVGGAWAPVDQFDALYPIARGVQASLRMSPQWKKRQIRVVEEVLKYRSAVMEEAAEEWDAYIRDVERVDDPDGGPPQEVPIGAGKVYKDSDGKMQRVGPDQDQTARDKGWKEIK